jgi:hypothetical protein
LLRSGHFLISSEEHVAQSKSVIDDSSGHRRCLSIQRLMFADEVVVKERDRLRPDTFFGMTVADAIKKYLTMVKRPTRTKLTATGFLKNFHI